MEGVHAMTDVTGYGLIGHLLEICRGSRSRRGRIRCGAGLAAARHLAEAGYATGASDRNWTSFGAQVEMPADWPVWRRKLLTIRRQAVDCWSRVMRRRVGGNGDIQVRRLQARGADRNVRGGTPRCCRRLTDASRLTPHT
jgi:hypothetical protein